MEAEQAGGSRVYRAVAAVVGVAGGGGVRPGRDRADRRRAGGSGRRTCCGRRASWPITALGLGLDAVPEVLLHPSVAERFTRCAPGLSGAARRTLRTNLRFIGRRVVPQLYPADLPLPRERAKAPYGPAEIGGFLALADAQPTAERRMRAAGLVCLGAGAGLIRGDLRDVRGSRRRVPVRRRRRPGQRARGRARCRCWPATTPGCWPRPGSPGTALICGGADPGRRNLTNPLVRRAGRRGRPAPAGHLPAAGDLAGRLRGAARAGHVHARGRDQLLPAARRPRRRPGAGRRGRGGPAARGRPPAMIPLAAFEEVIDASGAAPRIEAMLPVGVRARQLRVRTLLAGMCLAQADHRPAHLTRVHQALTALPRG